MSDTKPSNFNPGSIIGGIVGYGVAYWMAKDGGAEAVRPALRFSYIVGIGIGYFLGKLAWDIIVAGPKVTLGDQEIEVDGQRLTLRNPPLAAFLAWLVPGAGHLYQGRTRKGWIFMICILSTYFFGFAIGGGHVVYASWIKGDIRWHYVCQAPVGIVALPALLEGNHMRVNTINGMTSADYEPLFGGLMAPPRRPVSENDADELAQWYADRGAGYEMGTWYTMIAGLLNVLVIFDAYGGPLAIPISGKTKHPPPNEEADADESKEGRA